MKNLTHTYKRELKLQRGNHMLPRRTLQTIFILLLFLLSGFLLQGQTPGTNGTENWVKVPPGFSPGRKSRRTAIRPLAPTRICEIGA